MQSTYIQFPSQGQVAVETEELNVDNLLANEVIIRSETSIISAGTELARLHGLDKESQFPIRPGYGCIGVIECLGSAITDFVIGERVFFAGTHASRQRFVHAQAHQWNHLFKIPQDIDPIDAVLACMAQIAFTAPQLTDLKLGDTVAVFGMGLIGNLAAQLYRLQGARVIGIDPATHRCALARQCGITETIDCEPEDQIEAVRSLTAGVGAAVCVDAVGHSAIVHNAVQATAEFGQVVLLGTPRVDYDGNLTPAFAAIHQKLLTMRGAHMWTMPLQKQRGVDRDVEWAFSTIFDAINNRSIHARALISHVMSPEEVPAAYIGLKECSNEYTGVIIDWR